MKINFNLSSKNTRFSRNVYTLLDAFGDIGGLVEAAFIISTFILSPLYHNYHANNLGKDIDNKGLPSLNGPNPPDGPVNFTEEDEIVE